MTSGICICGHYKYEHHYGSKYCKHFKNNDVVNGDPCPCEGFEPSGKGCGKDVCIKLKERVFDCGSWGDGKLVLCSECSEKGDNYQDIIKEWMIEEKLSLGRMDMPLKKISYNQLRRLVQLTQQNSHKENKE